ncbi:enhanced filamentous growth protein 1, partial [Lecanoromycetidae sp. Uapishka_2]
MNQQQQYLDSQQSQLSGGQSYQSQPTTAAGMSQYPNYAHQPPVLQPGPSNYAPPTAHYGGQYGYPNGITSPQGPGHPVSSSMGPQMGSSLLPSLPSAQAQHQSYVGNANGPPPGYQQQNTDTSGQMAPSGMKPRVTATLWEDEGCMCFQVEAKGVCVARRDDNHMINGTKLLNVAGMTRGRRDGILKSEKTRHVVKIGPMHLKGVWIPFDRALDFANKEKITESLYPLFVHNIGALLYHPTNQSRTNAVMAAADRRRLDNSKQQGGAAGAPGSQTPGLHHHHSMNSAVGSQQPHSIAPHPGAGRPPLDRAHTFPTPPTSASSTIGLSNQEGSYGWGSHSVGSNVQSAQPLMLENHSQSTPATPATTPPGTSMPGLQPYQSHPTYDTSRSMYSAAPQQPLYASNIPRGASLQSNTYGKQDMGPPTVRAPGSRTGSEHGDSKADVYLHSQGNEHGASEDAEHEQESEYAQDNATAYSAHRNSYSNFNSSSTLTSLQGEHGQTSSTINGSPSHQNGSDRVTPGNSNGTQQQWSTGFHTPPRAPPSSNLFNPMSDARGTTLNGSANGDHYSVPPLHPYAPTQGNGVAASNKRMRDEDDYNTRPASRGDDLDALKRRKTGSSTSSMATGSYESDIKARPRNMASTRTRVR